jgi:hypothetical protein
VVDKQHGVSHGHQLQLQVGAFIHSANRPTQDACELRMQAWETQ